MKRRGILIATGVAAVLATGGAAIAGATGGDDDRGDRGGDKAITGSALDRASEAALKATGGGKVTETEVGDEESYYDVQLGRSFRVVGSEADHEDG